MNLLLLFLVLVFLTNYVLPQLFNDCRTSTGLPGVCYPGRRRCPITLIGERPSYCAIYFGRFAICCPSPEPIKESKIVPAPVTYFKCGERGRIPIIFGFSSRPDKPEDRPKGLPIPVPHIVGGIESFKNSWPWMVLVGTQSGTTKTFFCGGVVINHKFVLSAAHCLLDLGQYIVRYGEHDQDTPSSAKPPEDILAKDIIFHPEYKLEKGYYDIALLQMIRPVKFRNEVGPICLPWGTLATVDLVRETVTVTGWGAEAFGNPGSRVLREVNLVVFDSSVCNKSYSTLPDYKTTFPDGLDNSNIVCAGDTAGGKDACDGDSGGPMVHEEGNGKYTLAGIVSKGFGCGFKEFPGLYSPLRNYETLLWIKKTAF